MATETFWCLSSSSSSFLAPRSARQCPVSSLRVHDKATRWDSRIASGLFSLPRDKSRPSARGHCRRGLNNPAGLFIHPAAQVRQDPSHSLIQPLHRYPSVATSQSRKEEPRCRSNQPSLGIPAKVQMR